MDWFAIALVTRLNLQGSRGSSARGDGGFPKIEFLGADVQVIVFSVLGNLRVCLIG